MPQAPEINEAWKRTTDIDLQDTSLNDLALSPLMLVACVWWCVQSLSSRPVTDTTQPPVAVVSSERYVPGTQVRLLTDEDLVALFPGRPLAFVEIGGQRQVVFLDEL